MICAPCKVQEHEDCEAEGTCPCQHRPGRFQVYLRSADWASVIISIPDELRKDLGGDD